MQLTAGFFDESAAEDGTCYTVAGFIGNQLATAILELRWRDLLDKYELDYFKASELSAGEGQFKKFRDDPEGRGWTRFSKREAELFKTIKTEFTDVIIGCEGIYGIGAVVYLPDLERIRLEFDHAKTLPVPYFMCASAVMEEAGAMIIEVNDKGTNVNPCYLRPIFDSHEVFGGRAKSHWESFCEKNPNSSRFLLPPFYEKEEDYLTLQAADNLAFEARKLVETNARRLPMRPALERLVDNHNVLRMFKFNYPMLKIVADAQIGVLPEGLKHPRQAAQIDRPLNDLAHL